MAASSVKVDHNEKLTNNFSSSDVHLEIFLPAKIQPKTTSRVFNFSSFSHIAPLTCSCIANLNHRAEPLTKYQRLFRKCMKSRFRDINLNV